MTEIARNWCLHVDVGPEWLFFTLSKTANDAEPYPPLAANCWRIADECRIYRIVVEFGPGVSLTSYLVGQLVLLRKRSHLAEGVSRICGFSADNYDVLRIMHLDTQFPNYPTRRDAVLGIQP